VTARLAERAGTFIPTLEQHLLLRATLLTDRGAVLDALGRWSVVTPLERIDHGSARLLPQLYWNLERLGIAHPWLERFKGMYRRSWLCNELLLEGGRDAIRALGRSGIPVILLKGAALVASVVEEHALRPMQDFDMLVRRDSFDRAVEVLRREGWHIHPPVRDLEPVCTFQHAVSFRRGMAQIDLHWLAAWGMFDADGEGEFWRAARRVRFRGEETLVLASADHMLQAFIHATLADPAVPPIRWAADAVLLLRAEPSFDWGRLVRMAVDRRGSLSAMRCVEYLSEGLEVVVPDAVLPDLRRGVCIVERPYLRLRTSLGIGYRVHTLLMWLRTAGIDGVGHLPYRLWIMLRFVCWRLRTTPERSWGELAGRVLRR
jgi:hypothetical protein